MSFIYAVILSCFLFEVGESEKDKAVAAAVAKALSNGPGVSAKPAVQRFGSEAEIVVDLSSEEFVDVCLSGWMTDLKYQIQLDPVAVNCSLRSYNAKNEKWEIVAFSSGDCIDIPYSSPEERGAVVTTYGFKGGVVNQKATLKLVAPVVFEKRQKKKEVLIHPSLDKTVYYAGNGYSGTRVGISEAIEIPAGMDWDIVMKNQGYPLFQILEWKDHSIQSGITRPAVISASGYAKTRTILWLESSYDDRDQVAVITLKSHVKTREEKELEKLTEPKPSPPVAKSGE
ncbi:MAG: hypothetical protein EXS49_01200 [Candidatus Pacebacteria bacterium]|nr:hypothetical protein [Candidatus Paceibacterota bacterium]